MPNYRRFRIARARYFFTVTLADRGSDALVRHVDALRTAYLATAREAPFGTDAIVVLPDHLHAVWSLPAGNAGFSERWRKIKARFSRSVRGSHIRSASKIAKRERGLWQRRFWEHAIRDDEDWRRHVRYCWGNPVKHGLVEQATDWPFSSIHRDVRAGRVEAQWAGITPDRSFGA